MFRTGRLKNGLDAVDVTICPVAVGFTEDLGLRNRKGRSRCEKRRENGTDLGEVGEEDEGADCDNGLLIHDVELVRDGSSKETRAKEGCACLCDEVWRGGELVDELGRTLCWGWRNGGEGATGTEMR